MSRASGIVAFRGKKVSKNSFGLVSSGVETETVEKVFYSLEPAVKQCTMEESTHSCNTATNGGQRFM